MRSFKAEGIVLSKKNIGESDRIYTIFAKRIGKVRLIAKSVRLPKSRKRGHLEVFNKISFIGQHTHSIDIVTEVELIEHSPDWKKNLTKLSVGYNFVEVVDKLTREGEKNDEIFNLVSTYLAGLSSSKNLRKLREDFIREILIILGFWNKDFPMLEPDRVLEHVLEKKLSSSRIGKRVLS